MRKSTIGVLATPALLLVSTAAHSQDAWSTRNEIGFVAAHGNSDAETANAKIEVVREINKWKYTLATTGLYGKSAGTTTAQHVDGRFQTDHAFSERAFWFGAVRYEDDRFSGFDYQTTVTTGLGRKFLDSDTAKLSIQVGTGYRALRPELIVRDPVTGAVTARVLGERDNDVVVNGALSYSYAINDHTKVLDSLLTESGRANTLTRNDLSLEVKMIRTLAVSLGVSVRRNSAPQPGLKTTDTLTTVNLVYLKSNEP